MPRASKVFLGYVPFSATSYKLIRDTYWIDDYDKIRAMAYDDNALPFITAPNAQNKYPSYRRQREDIEWRPNKPFYATLSMSGHKTLNRVVTLPTGQTTEVIFEVANGDLLKAIELQQIGKDTSGRLTLTGNWAFRKHGSTFKVMAA